MKKIMKFLKLLKKKKKKIAAVAKGSFKLFLRCLPYQPRENKEKVP